MEITSAARHAVLSRASLPLLVSPATLLLLATLPCTRPCSWPLQHNHGVHIAEYKVDEKQHAKEVARSAYFPTIRNDSNFVHLTDTQLIQINAGSLGTVAGTSIPSATATLNQGGRDLDDQRHPADSAPDHAAENPARERHGASRTEGLTTESATNARMMLP